MAVKVFVSYEWGTEFGGMQMSHFVARVKRALEDEFGFEVWQDISNMKSGEISGAMAKGIEQADIVVVVLTQRYLEKVNGEYKNDNCRREFQHAARMKTECIVPLVLERKLTDQKLWTGRFGILLGEVLYQPMLSMSDFDGSIHGLGVIIRDLLEKREKSPTREESTLVLFKLPSNYNPLSTTRLKALEYVEGTRLDAVKGVQAWFHDWKCRILVFLGPAGYGKSVLMAYLCHLGGMLKKKKNVDATKRLSFKRWSITRNDQFLVGAVHFFKHDDKQANDVRICLKSIANQLAAIIPGYAKELASLDYSGIGDDDLRSVFNQLIAQPLSMVKNARKMVVLLDALDEIDPEQKDELLEIITQDWETLTPSWLGLIVSSRPEDPVKNELEQYKPRVLEISNESNQNDMIHYLQVKLKPYMKTEHDLEAAVELLSQRSEGLFLYASFLERTLMTGNYQHNSVTIEMIRDTNEFPDGLNGTYRQYFARFLNGPLDNDHDKYLNLFGAMVAARSPLPGLLVGEILGIEDEDELDDFLRYAEQLILVENGTIRFVHKSMSDFLSSKARAGKIVKPNNPCKGKPLHVKAQHGHKVLSQILLQHPTWKYSLGHMVHHLSKVDMIDEIYAHLFDFSWVLEVVKAGEHLNLVVDMDVVRESNALEIHVKDILSTLHLGQRALIEDPNQLASQLYGRIPDSDHPIFSSLAGKFKPGRPWLKPVAPSLTSTRSPLIAVFQEHKNWIQAIAMDGDMVVSGGNDLVVQVWNWRKPSAQPILLKGHTGTIRSVAIQGAVVVTASEDKTIRVWNWKKPKEPPVVLKGHRHVVFTVALQGDTIISGSFDKRVRIWDWKNPQLESTVFAQHPNPVVSVAVDGSIIVTACQDSIVRVWNRNKPADLPLTLEGHSDQVNSVAIEGNLIVSGSHDSMVKLWDWTKPKEAPKTFTGHSLSVRSVKIQGDFVASGSWDKTIQVWNLKTDDVTVLTQQGHTYAVNTIAFEGNVVLGGSNDCLVRVWNWNKRMENSTMYQGHAGFVYSVAIMGDLIVSGSQDMSVRVWNWKLPNKEAIVFQGHTQWVRAVAIDANRVVSGGNDNTVRVWDLESPMAAPLVFQGHTDWVTSVAIAGNVVVSGSWDEKVRAWDCSRPNERPFTFRGHKAPIRSVALLGDTIVSGSNDTSVRVWSFSAPSNPPIVLLGQGPITSVTIDLDQIIAESSTEKILLWDRNELDQPPEIFAADQFGCVVHRSATSTSTTTKKVVPSLPKPNKKCITGRFATNEKEWFVGFTSDSAILSTAVSDQVIVIGDGGVTHALEVIEM